MASLILANKLSLNVFKTQFMCIGSAQKLSSLAVLFYSKILKLIMLK